MRDDEDGTPWTFLTLVVVLAGLAVFAEMEHDRDMLEGLMFLSVITLIGFGLWKIRRYF